MNPDLARLGGKVDSELDTFVQNISKYVTNLDDKAVEQELTKYTEAARRKIKLILAQAFAEGYHAAVYNAGQPLDTDMDY